jgi:hypothetical protein
MRVISKLFLSLCLVVGLGATLTSNAQIESDATIRANIPYSFVVNNTMLPAGTYVITVPDTSSDLNVLEIRSANRKMAVLFDTEPVNINRMARNSELVFDQIGDTYFLSRIFMSGDEGGNQVLKSKKEKRLEENGGIAQSRSISATPVQAKSARQTARKMN